jgi:UDP-N-acetyl-D-galactosamine dehydrogenase
LGLGYVGLPLARLFPKYPVVGFIINQARIEGLTSGIDSTLEVDDATLQQVLRKAPSNENGLYCTNLNDNVVVF